MEVRTYKRQCRQAFELHLATSEALPFYTMFDYGPIILNH